MSATPNHDARAITVAQAVGDVIHPIDIFLFGSRARGTGGTTPTSTFSPSRNPMLGPKRNTAGLCRRARPKCWKFMAAR